MIISFVLALCIALVAIAFIEWLKKPLPKVSSWVWWGIAPVLCVVFALVATLLPSWVMLGLVAWAIATLFHDNVIKWAQAQIGALPPLAPPSG